MAEMQQRAQQQAQAKQEQENRLNDASENGIAPVVEITLENLQSDVVLRSEQVPVIVVIGGAAAPESVRLRNTLSEKARQAGLHWLLAVVDADTQPQVAQAFGVQQLPTVVAVAMGSPIGMFAGEKTSDWLDQWLAQVLEATSGRLKGLPAGSIMAGDEGAAGSTAEQSVDVFGNPVPTDDPRLAQAEELFTEGNFGEALEVYDQILASEPANTALKNTRTKVAFFARAQQIDRSSDPIARADAAPDDVALALDAADVEMLLGSPEQPLERLLELLPKVFGDEREQVRQRLLDLLGLFDTGDPIALQTRQRMASVLF